MTVAPKTPVTVVARTPNGREIRVTPDGVYLVQPHCDNYWIECQSVPEALFKFANPHEDYAPAAAAAIAKMIVDSWDSEWSIHETAIRGVSEEDRAEISANTHGDSDLDAAVVREIVRICRERQ